MPSLESRTVCVAGASGLVGSAIVKACLDLGWHVRGTLRDASDPEKAPWLMALSGARERLELFSADMSDAGSFDVATQGVDAAFIACLIPTYRGPSGTLAREMDDEQGVREIVQPTVDGCLRILRAAHGNGATTAIICSSTSSTNPVPAPLMKNEVDHWSDEYEQYRAKKYTSAAKTVMEKAAFRFAGENHMRMCVLLPSMIVGPRILPSHVEQRWIDLAHGKAWHASVPNDSMSMIDVRDLASLFLAAYETPSACGRYFGVIESWHWNDIYAALTGIVPGFEAPNALEDQPVAATRFDTTRRDSLGVRLRDIPTALREMIEWLRTDPFSEADR